MAAKSSRTRRTLLAGTVTGLSAVMAGCLGDGDDDAEHGEQTDGDSDTAANDSELPDDIDPGLVLNGVALHAAFPVRLVDPSTDERLAEVHFHTDHRHWHATPLRIQRGEQTRLEVRILDHHEAPLDLGAEAQFGVIVEPTAETAGDLVDITVDGDQLLFEGLEYGSGDYEFTLVQDGTVVWEAPPLQIQVG